MTGFRVAYGGAQSIFGVTPDLTTLGKIVGGGLPVGAYGGRADIMDHILPAGKVFQAGTLSGNPLATAAGIATLKRLRDDPPSTSGSKRLGERLAEGLAARGTRQLASPHRVARVGSMMTLVLQRHNPLSTGPRPAAPTHGALPGWFWELIERGIYMPCSQYEALFVSAAHSDDDIDATIAAAAEILPQLCRDVAGVTSR